MEGVTADLEVEPPGPTAAPRHSWGGKALWWCPTIPKDFRFCLGSAMETRGQPTQLLHGRSGDMRPAEEIVCELEAISGRRIDSTSALVLFDPR